MLSTYSGGVYGNNSGIAWGVVGVFEHAALSLRADTKKEEKIVSVKVGR
jgi:hypothetical protein